MYASIVPTRYTHPGKRAELLGRLDKAVGPAEREVRGFRGAYVLLADDGLSGLTITLWDTHDQAAQVATRDAAARALLADLGVSYGDTMTCQVARHIEP
jgi:heme-degrading monooxygenase HmoA